MRKLTTTLSGASPPRPRDLSFQAFRSFLTRSLKHSRFFTGVLLPLCQLGPLQVLSSLLPRGRSRQRTAVLGGEGGQSRRSPEPSPCPHPVPSSPPLSSVPSCLRHKPEPIRPLSPWPTPTAVHAKRGRGDFLPSRASCGWLCPQTQARPGRPQPALRAACLLIRRHSAHGWHLGTSLAACSSAFHLPRFHEMPRVGRAAPGRTAGCPAAETCGRRCLATASCVTLGKCPGLSGPISSSVKGGRWSVTATS